MQQETNPANQQFQGIINGYCLMILMAIQNLLDAKYSQGLPAEILTQVKEDELLKQRTILFLQDKIQEVVAMWNQAVQDIGSGVKVNPKGQRIVAGFKGIKGTSDNLAKTK